MKKTYKLRGFTLIELLVSIAIIGLISAAIIPNFRENSRRYELRLASEEMISHFQSIKTKSITGQTIGICAQIEKVCDLGCDGEGDCLKQVPKGGFGIFLTNEKPESFSFFADIDNNQIYDENLEKLKDSLISLPKDIEIEDLEIDNDIADNLTIIFAPPKGKLFINAQGTKTGKINLRHKILEQTRSILINPISGQIEIE